jgi:hypothetical protein
LAKVKQYYKAPNDFDFTPNDEFDFNSEKNMKQLEAEAKILKEIAMSYLTVYLAAWFMIYTTRLVSSYNYSDDTLSV